MRGHDRPQATMLTLVNPEQSAALRRAQISVARRAGLASCRATSNVWVSPENQIFERYLELRSVRLLKEELTRDGIISKVRVSRSGNQSGGRPFGRGALYELLANPIYLGEIRHRKLRHPGQHPAIVDRAVWEQVQERLRKQAVHHRTLNAKGVSSPLAGKLFDENDEPTTRSRVGPAARG